MEAIFCSARCVTVQRQREKVEGVWGGKRERVKREKSEG